MNHQDFQSHIQRRRSVATVATRRVMSFGAICYIVSLSICFIAYIFGLFLPLGIYVHPPVWAILIAHLIAILGACANFFFGVYALPFKRKWLSGTVMGGLCYAATLGALAWGIPSLSVHVAAAPVSVEATVNGSVDLRSRRTWGCGKKLTFGRWYAPGGSVCFNIPAPSIMVGSTVIMEGQGNSWATRITGIEGSYRP